MTPMESYQLELANGKLLPDDQQALVIEELQNLYQRLIEVPEKITQEPAKAGFFSRLIGSQQPVQQSNPVAQGVYLWGGVGRGKTHLCDMFYNSLPFENKMRLHYHRFMILVHDELRLLGNIVDPIDKVTTSWSQKVRILVLDEMHINDITDAMLMRHLLKGLFDKGVSLVTTSNRPPDDLYLGGLQRQQFIPAIELLKTHTKVLNLDTDKDYRLRTLDHIETYYTPIDDTVNEKLNNNFIELAGVEDVLVKKRNALINHREMSVIKWVVGVIWFEFEELCNTPRSNEDYAEISQLFHTVIISNIPIMDKHFDDAARRFVNMIDEFYDHNINLIISADAVPEELYKGKRLEFEFVRAASRLREMQSREYLAKEHGH